MSEIQKEHQCNAANIPDNLHVVAWDVYEHRLYGAPGETSHRILWVDDFRYEDGSTPDLDWILDHARSSSVNLGRRTIYVRPLYAEKKEAVDMD